MNTDNASLYVKWLKQEVAPALGCTEPVAISFAAAYAAQYLDQPCTKISGFISANLYKNAMGVTIPGTTVCGVPLAAAIGAFGGDPQKGLKTLEDITPRHVEMAQKLIANNAVDIAVEETPDFIHLDLTLSAGENCCRVVVKGTHTNVVELYINGQPQPLSEKQNTRTQRETLPTFSLQQAYEFINRVDFNDIRFILDAARLNSALAAEGKTKKYGLNINGTFSDAVKNGLMSNDLLSKVIINTVAASDARMGGAPVVAMSNFGSGNQGITATMPVVVVAEHLGVDEETLARALSLSLISLPSQFILVIRAYLRYAQPQPPLWAPPPVWHGCLPAISTPLIPQLLIWSAILPA